MDNKIHEAKKHLHEKELSDFHFTESMKRNVLSKISSPTRASRWQTFQKRFMPLAFTALFIVIFAGSVAAIIGKDYNLRPNTPAPEPNEQHEQEEPLFTEDLEKPYTPPANEEENIEQDQETSPEVSQEPQTEPVENPVQEETPDLTGVLIEFENRRDKLKQELADDYYYKSVRTKQEYYDYYSDLIDPAVLKQFGDNDLTETEEGLSVRPGNFGFYFDEGLDYSIDKLSDTSYQLSQYDEGGLYNPRTTIFTFRKAENSWIVSKIDFIY